MYYFMYYKYAEQYTKLVYSILDYDEFDRKNFSILTSWVLQNYEVRDDMASK